MSSVSVFVGFDYHVATVQVCVLNQSGEVLVNRGCPNDFRRIAEVVRRAAGDEASVFAAIEACTGAANPTDELIGQAGWSVHLAHPGYVARIKQSPEKTDWGDARLLADL